MTANLMENHCEPAEICLENQLQIERENRRRIRLARELREERERILRPDPEEEFYRIEHEKLMKRINYDEENALK
jgi:hypothetical protein